MERGDHAEIKRLPERGDAAGIQPINSRVVRDLNLLAAWLDTPLRPDAEDAASIWSLRGYHKRRQIDQRENANQPEKDQDRSAVVQAVARRPLEEDEPQRAFDGGRAVSFGWLTAEFLSRLSP